MFSHNRPTERRVTGALNPRVEPGMALHDKVHGNGGGGGGTSFKRLLDGALFCVGFLVALLLCLSLLRAFTSDSSGNQTWNLADLARVISSRSDDFYSDPDFSYRVGNTMKDWDKRRRDWLEKNKGVENYTRSGKPRVFLVSGSQFKSCPNPPGDHLLLRSLKNKQDYCRLHGIEMIYNNLLLEPIMSLFWSKIPAIRAAMVAHPEAEWIWWMDCDAVFTDMAFEHPFDRYKDYNFVVHGWKDQLFEKRSWLGINAGVFLIRNCEWSMRFLDRWAEFSPRNPEFSSLAKVLSDLMPNRPKDMESDDQSALVYLMLEERAKWGDKIYIENSYYFQGFWKAVVNNYETIGRGYLKAESQCAGMRRRVAERNVSRLWEAEEKCPAVKKLPEKRPFISHFAGCAPCSGHHNPDYSAEECYGGMHRALDFGDDQVLRLYGFRRAGTRLPTSDVKPLRLDP